MRSGQAREDGAQLRTATFVASGSVTLGSNSLLSSTADNGCVSGVDMTATKCEHVQFLPHIILQPLT